MNRPQVVIKTKSSHAQGMGDIMSSVALGRELRGQAKNVFFLVNKDKLARKFILNNGFPVEDIDTPDNLALFLRGKEFDISILNQLNTSKKEISLFKKHSKKLVTIEDSGGSSHLADLQFNILYPRPRAIIEFDFMPLADTFQKKHILVKQINKNVGTILVMQGGSDTHGFTPKIIKSLAGIDPLLRVNIVLGPYFFHIKELNAALRSSHRKFNIISKCKDLSDLMMKADIAISAAGNTLFELACLGVPTVVVCGEKFEEITAKRLERGGYCINLGLGLKVGEGDIFVALKRLINDYELRLAMSKKGKELVDGAGVKRMANRIIGLIDN